MQKHFWGQQTEVAHANFPFSHRGFRHELLVAFAEIKESAALAHMASGELDRVRGRAIVVATQEIRKGKHNSEFSLSAFQGGAGTSFHMNVNEVIAGRANELLAEKKKKVVVHPNDHVNAGQSTNDVNPSALKIASIRLAKKLLISGEAVVRTFKRKAKEWKDIKKLGRTHMQDAVPTTLGAEFASYAAVVSRGLQRIQEVIPYFYELNLGGTAIGDSLNASPKFREHLYRHLARISRLPLRPAHNLMSQTSGQTDFAMLSGALTLLTLDISKIANDLRLMACGPRGGFGEIKLKALQNGSSIMPGKVNPVLLEALNQLYFLVAGNDLTIREAVHASQFELSAMWPVIADRLPESLILTEQVLAQANKECFVPMEADRKRCKELLEHSLTYATYLAPKLGYDTVASVVKEAVRRGKTLREIVMQKKLLTNKEFDELTNV